MSKIFLSTFFAFSIILLVSIQANAQCVQCVPAPPGFGCGPSPTGGQLCTTGNGKMPTCTLTGYCSGLTGEAGSCDFTKKARSRILEISDKTILEIGEMSPRIAVNLISIRQIPVDFETGKISIADIAFNAKDVSKYLDPETPLEFFDSVQEQVKVSFESKKMPIVYDFVLQEVDGLFKLNLRTSDTRVPYPGVEITFRPSGTADETMRLEVIGWKFN